MDDSLRSAIALCRQALWPESSAFFDGWNSLWSWKSAQQSESVKTLCPCYLGTSWTSQDSARKANLM
eukprot:15479112-Alexandrium_andersonii.AAC.1